MTIAIVDDAVLIRQGLKKLIETSYPDVTIVGEASNGAEGLALLESNRVDVCIVDIRMPIMSGIEMVAQYRLKNQGQSLFLWDWIKLSKYRESRTSEDLKMIA